MKVRLIKCNDGEELGDDLTLGKVYTCFQIAKTWKGDDVAGIIDDAGEDNELYEGEYEIVKEDF